MEESIEYYFSITIYSSDFVIRLRVNRCINVTKKENDIVSNHGLPHFLT